MFELKADPIMAVRPKEVLVVMLDVGPQLSEHLVHLRKSLFLLAESKLLYSPTHEMAFVLYGTTETNNEVNREEAAKGEPDQYLHIHTIQGVVCPSLETLQLLNTLHCGRGFSHHVNALLVGVDLLKKALEGRQELAKARARKRLLLMGTFDTQVDELDSTIQEALVKQLAAMDAGLEVFCIGGGAPAPTPEAQACRDANLSGLHELLAQVSGKYRDVPRPVDMSALFTVGSVSSTGYLFPFKIGTEVTIQVQVFKKTDRRKLPSMRAYNPHAGTGGSGGVKAETEYRDPSNPDEPLPPEHMIKAFRYGQQLVPVPDAATAELMRYTPGKCLDLIGFTSTDNIPRWQYMSECWVALACQRDAPSEHAVALSALVHALKQENKAAVVRYCRTDSADMVLMAGLPLPAPATSLTQLDGLLLVKLPFKDDLRQFTFRTFSDPSKTHLYPTVQQATAMRRLVSSLRLAPDAAAAAGLGPDREQLVPDDTLNPSVQRFYTFMGQRALDPQHQVPDASEDLLAAAVLDLQPTEQLSQQARDALAALPELFPVTAPVKSAAAAAAAPTQTQAAATAAATAGGGHEGGSTQAAAEAAPAAV